VAVPDPRLQRQQFGAAIVIVVGQELVDDAPNVTAEPSTRRSATVAADLEK